MLCAINVKESDIVSIQVPEQYKNFTIEQFGRAGTWLKEVDSIGLNHWKIKIPPGYYEILGFAKDVFIEDDSTLEYDNFILRRL